MNEPRKGRTEFDTYAESYADLIRDPIRERFASTSRFFAERKLEIIQDFCSRTGTDTRKLDWLDVGCGQGELLRLGRPYFRTASGCDPSKGMLEYCSGLNIRHQPSIDVLPFDDNCYDFVTVVCVYHHVPVDRRLPLTQEVLRLLRPEGILCVIEHNPWNPVTRWIVSRTPVDADAQLLSAVRARRLLSAAGITVRDSRFFLLLPEQLYKHFSTVEILLGSVPLGGQFVLFGEKPK
jgi:SAM-dependent methyltransferase